MRILIISDSHGEGDLLHEICARVDADHVIHCGDFTTDRSELPTVPLTVVQGNCDWEEVPVDALWNAEEIRFYVTHGHRHQVNSSLLPIRYRAEEVGAQVACFGHSHFPVCEQDGEVLLLNPGSITSPRGYRIPTYAVLEPLGDGWVEVSFYDPLGRSVTDRGGRYCLTGGESVL
ncbi:hypothetical protein SAMN05444487_10242 [Marininema mesophilum]|uniref:Phosphoesterase n=1 Tax=Marininema mesophilum TaxID=1048340 RepID=A0A1H2RY66_9BACL|nr:metallophosphoesterase [Marininema mesophilum]SDW24238.1 hypothetical protein SAMN05444487_10242 [Marininema mesophilum]